VGTVANVSMTTAGQSPNLTSWYWTPILPGIFGSAIAAWLEAILADFQHLFAFFFVKALMTEIRKGAT
jgi:hypothetical protein